MKKTIALVAAFLSLSILPSSAFAAADAFEPQKAPDVCTAASIEREEIGGTRFPIKAKYKHVYWLGQLFTAAECGEERLKETFGGEDGLYNLGSSITLKREPNVQLRWVLKAAGYKRAGEKSYVQDEAEISVYKLLILKSFSKQMQSDDCVHCG